jgi:hypothetical protein
MLPSSLHPFLNVRTDGKKKDRHNREVLIIARLLRASGVKEMCLHHIDDGGMNHALPLSLDGKWYDIAYEAPDGELFLVEVMRLKYARGAVLMEDGSQWRKEKQNSPSSESEGQCRETTEQ